MKRKKLGFATVTIISLLWIGTLAFGKSADYLVPVTIKKADKTEIKGYVVLHAEEILRMGAWAPSRQPKGRTPSAPWKSQRVIWAPQKGQKDIQRLLEFEKIVFREGGYEVFITYGKGERPLEGNNFFSPKGIHFTTSSSNPDVVPYYLHPGKIRWMKRTGGPTRIR